MKIYRDLGLALAVLLAVLALIGLGGLGLDIPVLRQVVGFIFLTFVPGFLLLRFLRRDLGTIETILYSAGLSIAFIMFIGLFINMLYPLIGISRPISLLPVVATIALIVLVLWAVAYKKKAREETSPKVRWSELLSPPALLLLLLPALSALGTFWVYLRQSNIILLILILLIALIAALVSFGKFIPPGLYPCAVAAIAIALLWQRSLLSFDLPDGDILVEYYYQGIVLRSAVWDPNIPENVNAMLSVVMLAPVYSLVLNLSPVWVFKIIYPLIYCLVPLALFQAYRKQTDDKIAFFAAFFFMSFPEFVLTMPLLARQEIAELFVALSVLLIMDRDMSAASRAVLLIVFGLSIVVSHYGTSYVYMLYLLMAYPLIFLWRSSRIKGLWAKMVARFSNFRYEVTTLSRSTVSPTYVMLFIVFCLAWYMYVSGGSPFTSVVRIGSHIYSSLSTEFLSISSREAHVVQALGLAPMRSPDIEWSIARIFQYITQFFIVTGVVSLFLNPRRAKLHSEYMALALVSGVLIVLSIALPYFVQALNMTRLYHLLLFFLAPFCALGGLTVFYWLTRLFSFRASRSLVSGYMQMVVILVLLPYFLFGTGFIFEITGATPTSAPLSFARSDWPFFSRAEVKASDWLLVLNGKRVYGDDFSMGLLGYHYEVRTGVRSAGIPSSPGNMEQDSYIFLRHWNLAHDQVLLSRGTGSASGYTSLGGIGLSENPGMGRIYANNDAQVLWYSR